MIEWRKKIIESGKSVFTIVLLLFFSTNTHATITLSEQDNIQSNLLDSNIRLLKEKTNQLIKIDTASSSINGKSISKDSTSLQLTEFSKKKKKEKKIDTTHYSPKKAAIWGASFPGLGQIYNKKYWKLPIVYGVLGTAIYFVVSNGQKLHTYNGYIRNYYNNIPNPAPYNQLGLNEIESFRNSYRRNVQIAAFGTVFAWGLAIVDAVVDAHLHHFDISDKLTIKFKPELNYTNFTYYAGIGVHLNLK